MPSEPRTPRLYHATPGSAFTASGAFGVACAATATMLVGAVIATSAGAPVMVVALVAQLAMLTIPIVAAARSRRGSDAIGLRIPAPRFLVAGALLGVSAWYLNMRFVELLPIPEDKQLSSLIDRPSLVVVLLGVALAPAVCEEVLFRGVLARGFATRMPLVLAVLASAVMFSGYHMRLAQLPATFTLGLVFGYLAIRSDSAIPTMIAHLLNNAIALLIVRGELPEVSAALASAPTMALIGSAILTLAGIAVAVRRPRARDAAAHGETAPDPEDPPAAER